MNNEYQHIIELEPIELYESQLEGKEKVQYLEYEDGFTISPKCAVSDNPKAGIYNVQYTKEGLFFYKQKITLDDYVELGIETQEIIIAEIERFANKAELFKSAGVVHKRGILLYGPPGCGKTSFLNNLLNKFIEKNGLVFIVKDSANLSTVVEGLKILKSVSPARQIVVVIEEINKYYNVDQELLNFLDGQNSLQNMIILATTNQIEEMNPALLRPSRFDWIIEVGALSEKQRKIYLTNKNLDTSLMHTWLNDTKEFTIAQLKELFISVNLLDNNYSETLKKLKNDSKYQKNSTFKPIGFTKQ